MRRCFDAADMLLQDDDKDDADDRRRRLRFRCAVAVVEDRTRFGRGVTAND